VTSSVRSYRDLKVWRKGIDLVKDVYALLDKFPKHEHYALADQLRRSAVSVPSNIAEGQARQHTKEFRQFLYAALGSAAEVDTQFVIACELGYVSDKEALRIAEQVGEIRRMTYTLISRLNDH
jgi:four helix bundle protein